ncbi:MAG: helix-turn-helix domain-containing protein [Parasporobacterium sp.]|nr:helix-turn-helix domain-containing protein [Parasporobacterium sp.]
MNSISVYTKTEFTKEPQWDSNFKLAFVLKGALTFYAGSKERVLHTHDFTFVRPFELYGGSTGSGESKILIVDISPDLWKEICPNADSMGFSISILRTNDRLPAYQSVCRALARIVYYNSSSEPSASARICSAVSEILAILLKDYADMTISARTNDQTVSRIQDILQYIIGNYTRRFSLEEISGAIGFHPQYFSAYFKKNFGVSFTDYLNNYRVNKSIPMLRETRESILNIALACGFNSHKTYSNAFEKYYGCSPRDYRRSQQLKLQNEISDYEENDFDYLRRFWTRQNQEDPALDTDNSKFTIILDPDTAPLENTSRNFISIGRAISCLRSDMQQQLLRAKREMNLEFVRIRDIFSDDLFVYYEDRNKTPVFSWRALDEIFDFLVSSDLKPFIEIGYMPGQLASRKQYAGWQYHPNVSAPKSAKLWEMLVSSFLTHLISRYGKETIEGWLFDFWTSPNLKLEHGYWNDAMENFFHFYRSTYHAVKQTDPMIRLGSPNFSYPTGMGIYSDFFRYAKKYHLEPDFISVHLYSCGDGEDNPAESFIQYSVFDNNYRIPNIKPVQDSIPRAIDELRSLIDQSSFSGLPIIIADWNVTFFPTDFTRDTSFMGPFILENYFQSCDKVYGMGFASLSDIHEDFFNTDQLFNGGPGLLTYSGIPKSAYYAMCMAYRFSRNILQKKDNYIIGKTDTGYELLLFNTIFYHEDYVGNDPSVISFTNRYNVFPPARDVSSHIEIPVERGDYSVIHSTIGRNCGSSYDAWVKMGSPYDITPEISQYLERISTPRMSFETIVNTDRILLDEIIEPHSVLYIKISRQ